MKNFEPTDYTAMTNSVSALVEGIQVAFLTSINGLSFSLVYSYNLRSSYSAVTGALDDFLEEFHTHVMPAAEDESRNEMIASQKEQDRGHGRTWRPSFPASSPQALSR